MSEVDNPSELMQWEDFPELSEDGFEVSAIMVYEEMGRIADSLKKRWNSQSRY